MLVQQLSLRGSTTAALKPQRALLGWMGPQTLGWIWKAEGHASCKASSLDHYKDIVQPLKYTMKIYQGKYTLSQQDLAHQLYY